MWILRLICCWTLLLDLFSLRYSEMRSSTGLWTCRNRDPQFVPGLMTVSRFWSWCQAGRFLYLLVCGLVESPRIIQDWLFQRCHTGGHAVSTSISGIQTCSLNLITAPSPSLVTHTLWRKQKICLKYDKNKKSLPFGQLWCAHVRPAVAAPTKTEQNSEEEEYSYRTGKCESQPCTSAGTPNNLFGG